MEIFQFVYRPQAQQQRMKNRKGLLVNLIRDAFFSKWAYFPCYRPTILFPIIFYFMSIRVAMGLAFGIASVVWLGFIFNDTVIEIALTVAVSYIAFYTVSLFFFLPTIDLLLF
jgi:hypothetical protein